jgi:hypothetical protein
MPLTFPPEVIPSPRDAAFWRQALGARRPDGTMAEGPKGVHNPLWDQIGRPSAETQRRREREARQREAQAAEAARRSRRRRSTPAPVLAIPHPRRCKKPVRCLGRAA